MRIGYISSREILDIYKIRSVVRAWGKTTWMWESFQDLVTKINWAKLLCSGGELTFSKVTEEVGVKFGIWAWLSMNRGSSEEEDKLRIWIIKAARFNVRDKSSIHKLWIDEVVEEVALGGVSEERLKEINNKAKHIATKHCLNRARIIVCATEAYLLQKISLFIRRIIPLPSGRGT